MNIVFNFWTEKKDLKIIDHQIKENKSGIIKTMSAEFSDGYIIRAKLRKGQWTFEHVQFPSVYDDESEEHGVLLELKIEMFKEFLDDEITKRIVDSLDDFLDAA